MTLTTNLDYQNWLLALKQQVQQSQQKASLAVNAELVALYWSIGNQIAIKQQEQGWGTKVVKQLAQAGLSINEGIISQ